MKEDFERSLFELLKDEGGNDDDPRDHGGRTSRGITQREYDAFRTLNGFKPDDVWDASDAEIREIYHDQYWLPRCDSLPVGIDYLFFDLAVNAGPRRATIILQRALGVADDGHFGLITQAAANAANPEALVRSFSDRKRAFYRGLHQQRFLKGWLNRADHVEAVALAMVGAGKK